MKWICCVPFLTVLGCGASPRSTLADGGAEADLVAEVSPDLATPALVRDMYRSDLSVASKRVFATAATHDGNLGGLAGGDALCAAAASDMGLAGTTWVAWLSSSETNAIDRVKGAGPWTRSDGTVVFADRGALAATPSAPVSPGNAVMAFTGTALGGDATAYNCADWTSNDNADKATYGLFAINVGKHGESWTDLAITQSPCDAQNALLCFEN